MADPIRFGSPEYFQAVDQQVSAILAPQLSSGIVKQEQANEYRAEAQRKAQKAVSKFYGNSKYDGVGKLVRDAQEAGTKNEERAVLPFPVVTDPLQKHELTRLRKQRSKSKARRKSMKKAA